MINSEKFSNRLQEIMDLYQLSASALADKIGVQRSSISHILSGRNKPSLEFIMKVLSSFQEVDLYWLLNGRGEFPSIKNQAKSSTEEKEQGLEKIISKDNTIDRIVVFFKDGRFKNYEN